VAWCCRDETQHLSCLQILAASSQSLASNSPIVYSSSPNLMFGQKEATYGFLR